MSIEGLAEVMLYGGDQRGRAVGAGAGIRVFRRGWVRS